MNAEYLRCCEILRVKPGASLFEIKENYRMLAKMLHPDHHATDLRMKVMAEEKFKELQEAFERLKQWGESPPVERVREPDISPPVQPTPSDTPRSQGSSVAAGICFTFCMVILPQACKKTVIVPGLLWSSSHQETAWIEVFALTLIATYLSYVVFRNRN